MKNLARYIIWASFSQERMTYLTEPVVSLKVERESQIICRSKDTWQENIFDALDWLSATTSHIPVRGNQMLRYYGFYSNGSRGLHQKKNRDTMIPSCIFMEILSELAHLLTERLV
jgi:hypothetical protein